MNFKVFDNGKMITCKVIKVFSDENNNINYIIYTDGTKDNNGELEIYASRYVVENNEFVLKPILYDFEWNLIDNILSSLDRRND